MSDCRNMNEDTYGHRKGRQIEVRRRKKTKKRKGKVKYREILKIAR